MTLTISILYGSVRKERKGIMVAKFLEKKLIEKGIKIHFIDAAESQLPLLDKMYKEYLPGSAPEPLDKLSKIFTDSDGFLVVTGEYNHSIPPALKNLLDHFQREYYFKPSAIASYSTGSFGGVRAAVHLRTILGKLGMPAISIMQPFPVIGDLFTDDLTLANNRIEGSVKKFINELIWYAEALKQKRCLNVPY